MDGAMELSTGEMLNYLHFPSPSSSGGDTLWFAGWVTTSKGAVVGACVGLFLLGVVDRCVAGVQGVVGKAWAWRWVCCFVLLFCFFAFVWFSFSYGYSFILF
jgi:hypothetical protein